MKTVFYEKWKNNRIQKIVDLFGENWFPGKKILDLGCAHGDFGKHFLHLGSNVLFADINEDYLKQIIKDLDAENYDARTVKFDQNLEYNIKEKFDLVLHLSVLYHIENWKQDLKCALSHTNTMILETKVNPFPLNHLQNKTIFTSPQSSYSNNNQNIKLLVNQETIEEELKKLGCKFFRLDHTSLNTNWSWDTNDILLRHLYDWDYEYSIAEVSKKNRLNCNARTETHFRRMYLVLK